MSNEVFGVEVDDLEINAIPIEVLIFIKAMDSEGNLTVYTRASSGLNDFEKLGMIRVEARRTEESILDSYMDEEPREEDEDASGTD